MYARWVSWLLTLSWRFARLAVLLAATACGLYPAPVVQPTIKATASLVPAASLTSSPTLAPSPTVTIAPLATLTPISTPSPSSTATFTPSEIPTVTPSETPVPTYVILRGKILEQANCRRGPGAMYLYVYGVYPGYVMDIIGRTEAGDWVVVQAIGGDNPCWVKASLIEIRGDVMNVAPTYLELPRSPYYDPPTGVEANRDGNQVTVSWYGIDLRAGDDSEQTPYVIEAWLCLSGKIVFMPVGSYVTKVTLTDEAGCSEPSHARLLAAEKHGYTKPIEIPWPEYK